MSQKLFLLNADFDKTLLSYLSRNLIALADAFETDAKAQLTASVDKELSPEMFSMARIAICEFPSTNAFILTVLYGF